MWLSRLDKPSVFFKPGTESLRILTWSKRQYFGSKVRYKYFNFILFETYIQRAKFPAIIQFNKRIFDPPGPSCKITKKIYLLSPLLLTDGSIGVVTNQPKRKRNLHAHEASYSMVLTWESKKKNRKNKSEKIKTKKCNILKWVLSFILK